MSTNHSSSNNSDNTYLIIFVFIVIAAIFYFKAEIFESVIKSWMELAYERAIFMAQIPLIGGLFVRMATDFKVHPDIVGLLKIEYSIGILSYVFLAVFLAKKFVKDRNARMVWSNRKLKVDDLIKIFAPKIKPVVRQMLGTDEWMMASNLYDKTLDDAAKKKRLESLFRYQLASHLKTEKTRDRYDALILESAKILGVSEQNAQTANKLHAYLGTTILRILQDARETQGVVPEYKIKPLFATKEFFPIWSALQSLGGQSCFIEGAAIIEHFYSEIALQMPIREPQINRSLDVAMQFIEDRMAIIKE